METEHNKNYYDLLKLAAKYIRKAVQADLPQGTSKEFMLWLLSDNNVHQENYLRMMGVAGSIELELKLFGKVVSQKTLQNMAEHISLLNAYFAYETLSDNLGVGLASSCKLKNPNYAVQKQILLTFNAAMVDKINGAKENAYDLLASITGLTEQISVNQKTLSPEQMQIFIDGYLQYNNAASSSKLEHTFLEILVLNISTCLQLLHSLSESPIYPVLKQSLIARYNSVTHIINSAERADSATLANWGLDSILTVPTLAYCIGALNEVVHYANFKDVIDNNLLYEAMADAALLTRLLNDVGTRLLTMDGEERKTLYQNFHEHLKASQFDSIFSFLNFLSEKEEFFYILTRIRKDLKHGEFNVCLDTLPVDKLLVEALNTFNESIDYYADLYQQKFNDMLKKLTVLSDTLGDEQASKIIYNFVNFHERKYSLEFESMRGDYAITAKQQ